MLVIISVADWKGKLEHIQNAPCKIRNTVQVRHKLVYVNTNHKRPHFLHFDLLNIQLKGFYPFKAKNTCSLKGILGTYYFLTGLPVCMALWRQGGDE